MAWAYDIKYECADGCKAYWDESIPYTSSLLATKKQGKFIKVGKVYKNPAWAQADHLEGCRNYYDAEEENAPKGYENHSIKVIGKRREEDVDFE